MFLTICFVVLFIDLSVGEELELGQGQIYCGDTSEESVYYPVEYPTSNKTEPFVRIKENEFPFPQFELLQPSGFRVTLPGIKLIFIIKRERKRARSLTHLLMYECIVFFMCVYIDDITSRVLEC